MRTDWTGKRMGLASDSDARSVETVCWGVDASDDSCGVEVVQLQETRGSGSSGSHEKGESTDPRPRPPPWSGCLQCGKECDPD